MFESLVETFSAYPYLGVALVFAVCAIGLPLPEEIVLIAAGYVCAKFPDQAHVGWMMFWSATSILGFDCVPYLLGRVFGTKLLRIRWLRVIVTRRRLADFDRWFRRRGDLVIFFARFLAGIRTIAFFTAGVMKMPVRRFLTLDGLGIAIIVPLMVWIGFQGAGVIDDVIERVQQIERGLLWLLVGAGAAVVGFWLWRRRKARLAAKAGPTETFVEPQLPIRDKDVVDLPPVGLGDVPEPPRGEADEDPAPPSKDESAT
jgi:membrane protein DedA with SNARE-associated domain